MQGIKLGQIAAMLAILVATQPGRAQQIGRGYEPPLYSDGEVHSEKTTTGVGSFAVVRAVEDYRAAPIIEGPWLTKEAMLAWHDSSGRIGFSFVDDGTSVRFTSQGKSADGKATCIAPGAMVGYDPGPSTVDNWERLQPFILRQLRACTIIADADLARAALELKAAGSDYPTAANAWKDVARELFGAGGTRCVAERMVRPFTMPPRFECTRYSKR